MIVFDLRCGGSHVFEAWFGSTGDYEGQRARGLVACPLCGDTEIEKAVMAPNVGAKGNQRSEAVASAPTAKPVPMQAGPAPAELKAMLSALAKAQAKVLEGSEHVGPRFAKEARAIHEGDAPDRLIHGKASADEARALIEEGIAVAPLPLPIVPPERLQ